MKVLIEERSSKTLGILKQIYEKAENPENYLLHFSNIDKLGIKPLYSETQRSSTPFGIYGYSLKDLFTIYEGDINELPFGKERKYVFVIEISPNAKKYYITQGRPDEETKKLTKILFENFPSIRKYAEENDIEINGDSETFFLLIKEYATKKEHDRNPSLVMYNIFRNLGIDVLYDKGTGRIFSYEPYQAVVLNPSVIKKKILLFNPEWKKLKEKRWIQNQNISSLLVRIFYHPGFLFDRSGKKTKKNLKRIFSFIFGDEKKAENFVELFQKEYRKTISTYQYYHPLLLIFSSSSEFFNLYMEMDKKLGGRFTLSFTEDLENSPKEIEKIFNLIKLKDHSVKYFFSIIGLGSFFFKFFLFTISPEKTKNILKNFVLNNYEVLMKNKNELSSFTIFRIIDFVTFGMTNKRSFFLDEEKIKTEHERKAYEILRLIFREIMKTNNLLRVHTNFRNYDTEDFYFKIFRILEDNEKDYEKIISYIEIMFPFIDIRKISDKIKNIIDK